MSSDVPSTLPQAVQEARRAIVYSKPALPPLSALAYMDPSEMEGFICDCRQLASVAGLLLARSHYQRARSRILERAQRFDTPNEAWYREVLAECDECFLPLAEPAHAVESFRKRLTSTDSFVTNS